MAHQSSQASQQDDCISPHPLSPDHTYPELEYDQLKHCDLVMKGGITSGVVYPSAVNEFSRTYRFHSIGGTSAGAIAAAGAAAAELNRFRTRGRSGFDKLNKLPNFLGTTSCFSGKSNLFALFQPQAKTKALFAIAVASLGSDTGKPKRVILAVLRNFPVAALLGVLPAILLFAISSSPRVPSLDLAEILLFAFEVILFFIFGVASLLVSLVAAFGFHASVALKENYFGLCTGMPDDGKTHPFWALGLPLDYLGRLLVPKKKEVYAQTDTFKQDRFPITQGQEPLTMWLSKYLDELAGIPNPEKPLTFGDLRWGIGKSQPADRAKPDYTVDPAINLRMISTNLTLGRPYTLPFEFEKDVFYFDPIEWRKFFPKYIVEWLKNHSPQEKGDVIYGPEERQLFQLPTQDNLPVVVATRLSLSFPILLSAVPMYIIVKPSDPAQPTDSYMSTARDVVPLEGTFGREQIFIERCWFSDGGITSNFPIHFFDRPLPRWPTFAINLAAPPHGQEISNDPAQNVWVAESNDDGQTPPLTRYPEQYGHADLFSFFGSILYTARTWLDQTQTVMPGYRDRIAHIYLDKEEGGMNLNMHPCVIEDVSERGQFAAAKLIHNFVSSVDEPERTMTWDNHRWIRYRSSMQLFEEFLESIKIGYSTQPEVNKPGYKELLLRDENTPPLAYKFSPKQLELAICCTESLIELAENWSDEREVLHTNLGICAPEPKPDLQIRART